MVTENDFPWKIVASSSNGGAIPPRSAVAVAQGYGDDQSLFSSTERASIAILCGRALLHQRAARRAARHDEERQK